MKTVIVIASAAVLLLVLTQLGIIGSDTALDVSSLDLLLSQVQ